MNAIDQYVAPAPPRPNPPSAPSPRAGSDTSGSPSFGDVYNKAANANQSDNDPAEPKASADDDQQPKADPKAAGTAGKAAAHGDHKSTSASSAETAILALAADAQSKKTGKVEEQPADAKLTENADAAVSKQDGKDKVAADIEKLIDKANAAKAQAQTPGPATQAETDAAAIALKLLSAETVTKGQDKTLKSEETGKKEEPAKEKATDPKSEATGPNAEGANMLAAAALAVSAAGGQAGDHQEQGKPKSDEQSGKALSAIGAQAPGATTKDEATATSGTGEAVKPESITVLDARRFVGSGEGLSANTQAVMSGVTADNDWAATMKAASAAATATPEPRTGTPVNTLKIQMTPESIGNVTATLRLHGDQLTVHLQVESGEAFRQLSQDKEGLIQSLKSQGFSVDQVSVQLSPAPTTDKTVAQTSSGQQTGGQMQDGSSAGQFAQQGREQDNNRRQQDNGFNANWQGDDKSVAVDPLVPSSEPARSGQVYL
ncbi:flagellar hook-length control protein FliK [Rhizobium sp. C4]|uniref:flagellar hook-length control protein FliK n=1 Tax=Rhizobium sp. C4 TaxID=1349800 RepID=UPI001E33C2B9|nr:flagellar hook-length control protein FliK [Rhizobium sp. C4]MCD2172713.1 flagellar hook-length control protein FliK [Rhizobium sp. C4]